MGSVVLMEFVGLLLGEVEKAQKALGKYQVLDKWQQ